MLTKRIIPCLDVTNGRVVKGINFADLRDAGDPVNLGSTYWRKGADELVYLDITATSDNQPLLLDLIGRIAQKIFIPFTIGGGIKSIEDMSKILSAGADKISINSATVSNPNLIEEGAKLFGSQCIVVAVDVKKEKGKWKVYTHGGRTRTKWDALEWLAEVESLGAGEILLTSIDRDGTKTGFDIELYRAVSETVGIPIIASGGGGTVDDFIDLFKETEVTGALAASIFHYNEISIGTLKWRLKEEGIPIRLEELK